MVNSSSAPTRTCGALANSSVTGPNRTVPRILGFEITKAGPIKPFPQIDLGDLDRAPFLRLRHDAPFPVVDCRHHPILLGISVRAADEEHVILAGARGCQH